MGSCNITSGPGIRTRREGSCISKRKRGVLPLVVTEGRVGEELPLQDEPKSGCNSRKRRQGSFNSSKR